MLQRTVTRFVTFVMLCLIVGGCGTTSKALNLDTRVELDFLVWDDLNPDDSGRASPLVVRFYELRDPRAFEAEDFIGLYEEDSERLGDDMITKRKLREFEPGESRIEEFVVDPSTRYIGLLGEFVQYETAKARVVIPVKPNQKTKQTITMKKLDLLFEEFVEATEKKREPMVKPNPYHVGD